MGSSHRLRSSTTRKTSSTHYHHQTNCGEVGRPQKRENGGGVGDKQQGREAKTQSRGQQDHSEAPHAAKTHKQPRPSYSTSRPSSAPDPAKAVPTTEEREGRRGPQQQRRRGPEKQTGPPTGSGQFEPRPPFLLVPFPSLPLPFRPTLRLAASVGTAAAGVRVSRSGQQHLLQLPLHE